MSEQQMERARNNLRSAESRLAQANKQRAQALAKPKAAEARGIALAQLDIFQNSVRDADSAIEVAKGQLDLHRQKIFSLKQARAAQKALKKLVKQQSVASEGDLIPAVHAAVPATATAEVASSTAKEPLGLVEMALFFAGVGCVVTFGTVGFVTKKLRLW